MGGAATGTKALDWIFRWIVLPVIGLIGLGVLFFFAYGVYAFFW